MKKVIYYNDYNSDVIKARDQNYKIKDNYKWIRKDPISVVLSFIIYNLALLISFFYLYFVLKMKIVGRGKLKKIKGGYFIYANHTQEVGDAFISAHAAFIRRVYVVVGQANYSLPFIGKILPYLGALPTGDKISEIKNLNRAIDTRIKEGKAVVIYPEAHVWPYYTKIRPFMSASFKYPTKLDVPSFSMTTTYQKRKRGKRPKMVVYIDGPFSGSDSRELCEAVKAKMEERSKLSNNEYIEYKTLKDC